jgi:hypothetical protein
MDKKKVKERRIYFTDTQKHHIIQDFVSSNKTKVEIWKKYTGEVKEHGNLLRWMRSFGYNTNLETATPYLASNLDFMARKKRPDKSNDDVDPTFDMLQMKKRIAELEKQLKEAELKAIAFSAMVDIAEKEFKIPIRKKLNTKP